MIFELVETACKWPHVNAETRIEMYSENIELLCRLCNLLSLYVIGEIERKIPYGRSRRKWRIILKKRALRYRTQQGGMYLCISG
jgi:hypothetical protein